VIDRKYVILNASEASTINFDEVIQMSSKTLRWNTDQSQTFVKYEGVTPDWLVGKTTYTHPQMLTILNNPDGTWIPEEL